MPDLALDASRSKVRIHTFAEGLFARLAHDLELSCDELSGSGTREVGDLRGEVKIEAALRGLSVTGVLRKDLTVDAGGLSANDRKDIIEKMRGDVFHDRAGGGVVRIEARLDAGSARVRVLPPRASAVEIVTRPDVRAEGDAVRATGRLELSLAAIGSAVVKGPMNAFRVKDGVVVLFDVVFVPAGGSRQPA